MDRIEAALKEPRMYRYTHMGPSFEYYTCFRDQIDHQKRLCINTLFNDSQCTNKIDRAGTEEVKLYDWDIVGIRKMQAEGPYYVRKRLWVIELPAGGVSQR